MLSWYWYWFWVKVDRMLFSLLSRTEVVDREAVPLQGPVLIASNHISYIDPVLLPAAMPRKLVFLAKEELFQIWGLGWFLRAGGVMPVKRGYPDRAALRRAEAVLKAGGALCMFPEGTRSKDARLLPGQTGVAFIALRCGVPVLPVGISGTQSVSRPGDIFRRPRITLKVGHPIFPQVRDRETRGEALRDLTHEIMMAIAALLPPEQRGMYGEAAESAKQQTAAVGPEGV